jgi:abortive infection bacteriophage resistance protein
MSNRRKYSKKALSVSQQVDLLRERRLEINDEAQLNHYLKNISYYHLSGYFKPFQNADESFVVGTTFSDILNIYFFDRKLRLLFINALERIEKSFKAQFVNTIAVANGPDCLVSESRFTKHLDLIVRNLKNTKEPFIKQFKAKYTDDYPPTWILCEVLSFGDINNIYRNSLDRAEQQIIAEYYQMNWRYLYSWLEHLREVRNICAHYSRLWNKRITKKLKQQRDFMLPTYESKIFDTIIITGTLLKTVSPTYNWLKEILNLIQEYSFKEEQLKHMGFPSDWTKRISSV